MKQAFSWSLAVGLVLLTFHLPLAVRAAEPLPDALFRYVERDEPKFGWKLTRTRDLGAGKIYDIKLTSQVWQEITWRHDLIVFEPAEIKHPKHVLLFISGGSNGRTAGSGDMALGNGLARLCGARVALLRQVPNQPLLDGRKEDDLITETWLRYLKTGDENWPLLFPMVKSAVKAMDAIEQIGEQHWDMQVEGFVITGASKRGWTSWLTPVADKRVIATAPIVIDVLNFRAQMKHQKSIWGKYSEQINDYTSKGLIVEGAENPRESQLRRMMDPYTYRERVTIPKLLINGANDRYWVLDAMNLYWDDLTGPKAALHLPNAGHGLDGGRMLALSTVAAFFQHAVTETPLPQLTWSRQVDDGGITLSVRSDTPPKGARLWVARSATRDFREAKWRSAPLSLTCSGAWAGSVEKPEQGHVAHFAELQFEFAGVPYSLCTLIQRD